MNKHFTKESCHLSSECADARGMQNSIISDAQLSASSSFNSNEAANQGRLHNDYTSLYAGAWVAATTSNEWIQIDLLSNYTRISRVATQGRHHVDNITYQWVKKYNLKYSDFENDTTFRFYMEEGQSREKVKKMIMTAETWVTLITQNVKPQTVYLIQMLF